MSSKNYYVNGNTVRELDTPVRHNQRTRKEIEEARRRKNRRNAARRNRQRAMDTGFDSIVDFWRGRNIEAFRQPSIASPSTPKDVSLKKGTSTKKKKKKSDHVPKESKKETKEVKETKEIVEKKKPEKKKLPEAIRKKIRTELKDEKLPAGKYTSIYKAVEESENKLALNNALVKTFDTSIGSKIYNHIKKIYEDYQR